ncbi:exodeoxyribonuclease V subunit gamma [Nocardioides ginkgobilobae]
MTLLLHRAARTDQLVDGLAALLAEPSPDPFAEELVVVPARGVERWLTQRLSHRLGAAEGREDGVCAGVALRSPWSLVAELLGTRDEDPWSPETLTWPLIETLDACLEEEWAVPLALHLGAGRDGEELDLRRGRRFAVARRLAGLFASYAVQRPALLADWHTGGSGDGCGRALPEDLAWQPHLWRRLAERVGAPPPQLRHEQTLARLRDDPGSFDLPPRLSLFGHTRLPGTEAALLGALGAHRDVHLWLPHPSAALWAALQLEAAAGPVARREDLSHRAVTHPLLSSLGRDVRELQRTLGTVAVTDLGAEPDPATPGTLLGWLQSDLRADRVPDAAVRAARTVGGHDRSVQVHRCHGPARQVEVLREVLLGLLADDPTLEPRDVLVMCPDIEAYAPLVQAAFGLGDVVGDPAHPAHRLRVRLADRALSSTNPLLAVAARLLDLAGGRATASEVVDLAHEPAVRRRFGLRDDDLQQLTSWVRSTGVRWAFDADHRTGFGLGSVVSHTWEFGLDRLLAGVAMSDDTGAWLDRTLPLDDVGSGQVDLAGRVVELVRRLREVTDRLVGTHPLEHWLATLAEGLATLTSVAPADSWQSGQVQRELARVREAAAARGAVDLRLPDVRALLSDRLGGRPTRANFRTGTLTVSTLVPMRSVPHRVICLVGLDDGVFPRVGALDGDDVLARDPVTGERDPRSEDRQLFLDAVLAATETLVVTCTGANEFSGQPRPPAVPVGELLDALDLTATPPRGAGSVADAVSVEHPLQPFDERNFTPGALGPPTPFSFDAVALTAASAARGEREPVPPLLAGPLPPAPAEDVQLDDLVTFFCRRGGPVAGFLSAQRLDLALPREDDPLLDALPVELDQLQRWQVGDRLLHDLLTGADPEQARQQEWRRGELPPGQLGWRLLTELVSQVVPIAEEVARLRTRPATQVDVDVDLGGGRRLRGTVPEVFGDRLVPVSFSRLGATHRLTSWIRLLALAASDEERSWTAHTVGRPTSTRAPGAWATSLLGPVDHRAVDLVRDLVALRDAGLCEPLPIPLKASLSYARVRRTQGSVDEALRKAGWDWEDGRYPGECSDPAHVAAWGRGAALPGLDLAPGPGEESPGETSRFGALAMRLWSPLLTSEQGSW